MTYVMKYSHAEWIMLSVILIAICDETVYDSCNVQHEVFFIKLCNKALSYSEEIWLIRVRHLSFGRCLFVALRRVHSPLTSNARLKMERIIVW